MANAAPKTVQGVNDMGATTVSDEVDFAACEKLRLFAKYMYIELYMRKIMRLAKEDCDGCKENYCSQRDHTCLMYDTKELWELYFVKGDIEVNLFLIADLCMQLAEFTNTRYTEELGRFIFCLPDMDLQDVEDSYFEICVPPTSQKRLTAKFVNNLCDTIGSPQSWSPEIFADYATLLKDGSF